MKIGVIQASSQKDKNDMLYRCVSDAALRNSRSDEVINFGVFGSENVNISYVETALEIGLLLSSGAVDFIVTGCSSGQGMMLACNSLPGMMCGFVQTPQDAFLFGRINGGNAVSVPLGLNFGWLGDINLQCVFDKLFDGDFGVGYPPEDADRKKRDADTVRTFVLLAKRPMTEVLPLLDRELVNRALGRKNVTEYILSHGKNAGLLRLIRSYTGI